MRCQLGGRQRRGPRRHLFGREGTKASAGGGVVPTMYIAGLDFLGKAAFTPDQVLRSDRKNEIDISGQNGFPSYGGWAHPKEQ